MNNGAGELNRFELPCGGGTKLPRAFAAGGGGTELPRASASEQEGRGTWAYDIIAMSVAGTSNGDKH